jgi:hypothetical protein
MILFRCLAIMVLTTTVGACQSSKLNRPVEECIAYQKAMAACTKQPEMPFATQDIAIPHTATELERLTQLCTDNLARIHEACR